MSMKRKTQMLILILIGLVAAVSYGSVTTKTTSQERTSANTKAEKRQFIDEAKIKSLFENQIVVNANLENILAHPTPKFQLIFECLDEGVAKANCKEKQLEEELSVDAKLLVEKYWAESLTFRYNSIIKEVPDYETAMELDTKFSDASFIFERELGKLSIESPKGKRQIYESEVNQIIKAINLASAEVIAKAKGTTVSFAN